MIVNFLSLYDARCNNFVLCGKKKNFFNPPPPKCQKKNSRNGIIDVANLDKVVGTTMVNGVQAAAVVGGNTTYPPDHLVEQPVDHHNSV